MEFCHKFQLKQKMLWFKSVCVIIILRQHIEAVASVDALVNCKEGQIRGKVAANGDSNIFLSIPNAKVDKINPFVNFAPCTSGKNGRGKEEGQCLSLVERENCYNANINQQNTCTFEDFYSPSICNAAAIPRVASRDEDTSGPVVTTTVGSIRGLRADDGDYSMFMGIPYAEVNRENVFGPALPYPRFESTFDAYDDSAKCPQIEEFNNTIVGTLDCLHLNIYVPNTASDKNLLPVFVWIFGGLFKLGFAGRYLYGPSFLVRHDIIVVTFNYRLGPYGFMCLDTPEVPGNEALKDQILALRWIKGNIGAFGGDATRITLSGNSGGGMSTNFHLYYAKEDLFKRIIPQSIPSMALQNGDPTAPLRIANVLNYTPNDVKDALSYLSAIDPHDVIAAVQKFNLIFFPCIEKKFANTNNYITVHPLNLDVPRVKDIDVLIGFNNDEKYTASYFITDATFATTDFVLSSINKIFDFGDDVERLTVMKQIVTHFYFGDNDITADLRQKVNDMTSDFDFIHNILRTVKKYLDNGVENMYLYVFSYSGERNFNKHRVKATGGGAAHADELGYLFDISYMEKPLTPDDQLIVDRMTYLWTNFIKYGNPTPVVSELVPVEWPRVTKGKWNYIDINTELQVSSRPLHDRMAFLDLFFMMNEQFQRGYEPQQEPSSAQNVILNISIPLLFALKYFL